MNSLPVFSFLVWLLAAFAAAFIVSLDSVTKFRDKESVFRTKEWWLFFGVNTVIAFFCILFAYTKGAFEYSLIGFIIAIFSYPLLLHTKIFSFRSPDKKEETPIGAEIVLNLADNWLIPGIKESLQEQGADLLKRWQQADILLLIQTAENYVTSHSIPEEFKRTKDEVFSFCKILESNSKNDPGTNVDNCRVLYLEIEKIGGLRGIRWILDHAKIN